MKRTLLILTLALTLVLGGMPAVTYAFEAEVAPHVSEPVESEHVSTSEEESTTSHSSASSEEETHVSTYHGTTYHNNASEEEYFNTSGTRVWYWLYFSHGNYYQCYDQNHNRTTCDRQPKTVNHNNTVYTSSDPYTDTANKTVRYYFTRYNQMSGKPWYACFDDGFNRITCNRK